MNVVRLVNLKKFRLRVIDLLGVLFVVAAIFTVAFFFLRKAKTVDVVVRMSEGDNAYKPWASELPLWYASALQVGMAQYDSFGKTIVEIVDKKTYPSSQDYHIVDVTLRMRAVYDKRAKQYLYNGDKILIGSVQKFLLGPYVVHGLVRDINNTARYHTKKYLIRGYINPLQNNMGMYGWDGNFSGAPNTTGVPTYFADSILVGDAVLDSNNHAAATITAVDKRPAVFILANTVAYGVVDQRNTEVYIDLELEGEIIGGKPMYLGISPIVVNSTVILSFKDKTLTATITNITEPSDSGTKKE